MKTLLIDDLREIKADVVARTFDDGIQALRSGGKFDVLYLDHDLGEDELCLIEGDKYPKTGYGIMVFLENNPHLLPGEIVLVTSNPVGRKNMQAVINKLYGERK